jgi:hypothetical protein
MVKSHLRDKHPDVKSFRRHAHSAQGTLLWRLQGPASVSQVRSLPCRATRGRDSQRVKHASLTACRGLHTSADAEPAQSADTGIASPAARWALLTNHLSGRDCSGPTAPGTSETPRCTQVSQPAAAQAEGFVHFAASPDLDGRHRWA